MIKLINILHQIIENKQVGNLYHFTYLSSVSNIHKKGIHFAPDNTELPKYKDKFYISTTRDYSGRKFAIDSEYVVRITLDGSKISEHYSIEPINQNYLLAKNAGFNDNVNKSVKDVYYEERIWSSKEEYLDPKYIIKIDTIVSEDEIKSQLDWGKEDSRRKLYFDDNIFKYINFIQDYNTK